MPESSERKVYRIKAGNIANLMAAPGSLNEPAADEVQIQVKAIGLNFADLTAIWGLYSATPKSPFIPGLEYSGIIIKAGRHAPLKVGQRVMGVTKFGAYATHLNIDHRYVVPLPYDWSFAHGAAFLVQAITAYYALVTLGNIHQGQSVLIHSGAGGVGLYALKIAKKFDAFTIGTTGHKSKLSIMNQVGYDAAITRSKSFKEDLRAIAPKGEVDIILECIGGRILKEGFELLAPEGRMIIYGAAHFATPTDRPNYLKLLIKFLRRPKIDPLQLPTTNRSILGFNLIWLYDQVEKMHQILHELDQLNLSKPVIGNQFSFDDLPSAVRKLRSGLTSGKVIVET